MAGVARAAWRSGLLILQGLIGCSGELPPDTESATRVVQPAAVNRRAGFEANRGQWPAAVRFVARDGAATLVLTDRAAVWQLPAAPGERRGALHMRWLGAQTGDAPSGEQPRRGRAHYARGPQAAWHFDVPLFDRVVYRDVYPGIDLVFHDARGRLEYDFVVAPGADPAVIRLAFDGGSAQLGADGALTLSGAGATLVHHPPLVFQDTPGGRRRVAGRYAVAAAPAGAVTQVGFALAAYDRAAPLIIDPQVGYETAIDRVTDNVVEAAVDADGNLWLVGVTPSLEFPITPDAADDERSTFDDNYVVKLDAQGQLVYATYLGGSSLNCIGGVAVDEDGNAYVAGTTSSTDFPVTGSALQGVAPGGGGDGFLAKLDGAGHLLHATYFGGAGYEWCSGRGSPVASIAVGPEDAVYAVIGITLSVAFPAPGASRDSARLDGDALVARFDRDLQPVWGRFIGSSHLDGFITQVAADAAGNAYVYGKANRALGELQDFPVTPGAFQTTSEDFAPNVLVKYAPNGDVVYATFLTAASGSADTSSYGDLAVGADGTAYVATLTGSATMPVTPGAYRATLSGFSDLFIFAVRPDGAALRYGTYLGGSGAELANTDTLTVALDGEQLIVGTGTESNDFPLRHALATPPNGSAIAKLNADGSDLVYASYVTPGVHAIAHGGGALYVAGRNLNPALGIGAARIDEAVAPCAGDCDGDLTVRINELITGVRIALGDVEITACASFDRDADETVSIAELIGAVGALLNGCPA